MLKTGADLLLPVVWQKSSSDPEAAASNVMKGGLIKDDHEENKSAQFVFLVIQNAES